MSCSEEENIATKTNDGGEIKTENVEKNEEITKNEETTEQTTTHPLENDNKEEEDNSKKEKTGRKLVFPKIEENQKEPPFNSTSETYNASTKARKDAFGNSGRFQPKPKEFSSQKKQPIKIVIGTKQQDKPAEDKFATYVSKENKFAPYIPKDETAKTAPKKEKTKPQVKPGPSQGPKISIETKPKQQSGHGLKIESPKEAKPKIEIKPKPQTTQSIEIKKPADNKPTVEIKPKPQVNITLKNESKQSIEIKLPAKQKQKHEIQIEKPTVKITAPPPPPAFVKPQAKKQEETKRPAIQIVKTQTTSIKITPKTSIKVLPKGMMKHNMKPETPQNTSFTCPDCKSVFTDMMHLQQHFIEKHELAGSFEESFILSQSKKANTTICAICKEEMSADSFIEHCTTKHQKEMLEMFVKCPNPQISNFANSRINEEKEKEKETNEEKSEPHEEEEKEETHKSASSSSDNDESDLSSVSSSSEASSSDDDDLDDDYMAFVTSTIDMTGIAAPGKKEEIEVQPTIEQKEPEKIEEEKDKNKEEEEPFRFESYLSSLTYLEEFLTRHNAIQIVPNPRCLLCSKDYPSCVMLMKHCYETHRPRFTSHFIRALDFIYPGITLENTDDELLLRPELNMELTLYPTIKIPENPTVVEELLLPHFTASLIIEVLAVDNNTKKNFLVFPKEFNDEVLMLRLPTPLPVIVKMKEEGTLLRFIDTPHCSAHEISTMLVKIAEREADGKIISIRATNAHPSVFPDDSLITLSETFGCTVLHDTPVIENGLKSMEVFVFSSSWTDELEESVKNELIELYYSGEMSKCTKCGEIYQVQNPGTCQDGGEHDFGDQVSFAEICTYSVKDL